MIKVGCCGFPLAQAAYYLTFGVVEIQKTFYEPPRRSTLVKWRNEAPDEFEFTLKAWQLITHEPKSPTYRRLRRAVPAAEERRYGSFRPTDEVFDAWGKTREAASALRARIVLFQCPPSFTPSDENVRNMMGFFSAIDREGVDLAWEPRGEWANDLVAALCRDLDLIHAVDPFLKKQLYGRVAYYRLHGIGGYRYRYSDEELSRLSGLVVSDAGPAYGSANQSGRDAYCLFNNSYMKENAQEFKKLLGEGFGRPSQGRAV